MTTVGEDDALRMIDNARSVFLLEPDYPRKYLPLGLAKIAARARRNGASVEFGRHYNGGDHELIAITSMFTNQAESVGRAYDEARFFTPSATVLLGGIYASLMTAHAEERMPEARIFCGYSKALDTQVPDYGLDYGLDEHFDKFSRLFTTRGCPNRCAYCGVPRLEPSYWIVPNWREHIADDKPYIMVSDNNLSAAPPEHLSDLLDALESADKRVMFEEGFDCKYITPQLAERLARLRYVHSGLRLAFDRIEEDGVFQAAVRLLLSAGVTHSQVMAFCLFNFQDTPAEADYRMRECVRLGIRPYPTRYQPLNTTRSLEFVGRHWTQELARSFRAFWLFAGAYGKMTFDDFAHGRGKHLSYLKPLSGDALAAWEESTIGGV